ncbi:MAG: DciA family protein [Sphingomicrobium sp.]
MAWSPAMMKPENPKQGHPTAAPRKPKAANEDSPRGGRARSTGELLGALGGRSFKRFGFIQSSVVSRWNEIVGERYARVSSPESIRFPQGRRAGGALTLLVEGAHAPLIQHLAPMIIERVNRFFGYCAIDRIVFRQGKPPAPERRVARPAPPPLPRELGEGLREIVDPELRACLESLASQIAANGGPPTLSSDTDPLISLITGATDQ